MNSISIITICFNNLAELKKTLKSVDNQSAKPFEHIIIDGSANTDIYEYLNQTAQPHYRIWVNERDKGISDAFNKGINKSTGNIIQFLNSADTYYDHLVVESINKLFEGSTDINWCHGQMKIKRGGQWVIIGKPFDQKKLYRGMRSTFHPTLFVRKHLFDQYGGFDLSLQIAMDYDFIIRIRNEPFVFLEQPMVVMDPDGISNIKYLEGLEEIKQTYLKYFGHSIKLNAWQGRLKILHFILSSPIGKLLYVIKKKLKLENI